MTDLTVPELQQKQKDLEVTISKSVQQYINDFATETGVNVKQVDINLIDVSPVSKDDTKLYQCDAKVSLDI